MDEEVTRAALFSPSGEYRYSLSRVWDRDAMGAVWILLNPSTADAKKDDPTVRRCVGFSRRMDYGWLLILNLFALRSSDPGGLLRSRDPVGPENDSSILDALRLHPNDPVIVGWGTLGGIMGRDRKVLSLINQNRKGGVFCLGRTKHGYPRHPLRRFAFAALEPYEGR